ncbi:hypothetical protein ACQKGD_19580 [Peribacillus frigoritolerans]
MPKRKQVNLTHEFVGNGEEDLKDIFQKQFVRWVNTQKGYSYLKLKTK